MKLPQTLYLDLNTWRCGGIGKNQYGKGSTQLLNRYGYSCCLGQWIKQARPNANIHNIEMPKYVEHLNISTLCRTTGMRAHTKFTKDCININDDEKSTVNKKIKLLRAYLKKSGRTLRVKRTVGTKAT